MSRGLGKVERKILQGFKKYEEYKKERGENDHQWRISGVNLSGLSHYIEGNCEELFLDSTDIFAKFSHSTYIKTYNAIQSLKRKGFIETKTVSQSYFFNDARTRCLLVRLKH